VTRTDLPFKKTMKLLFLVPFMLPSFIGALAWKMLLSPRAGYINRFSWTLGFDSPIFNIYILRRIILVETMYLFPFVSSRSAARWNGWTRRWRNRPAFRRRPVHHHAQDHHPAGNAVDPLRRC
jgi:ABC-type Fe3+ transport system, permease component